MRRFGEHELQKKERWLGQVPNQRFFLRQSIR
jgi:hypothetical protein